MSKKEQYKEINGPFQLEVIYINNIQQIFIIFYVIGIFLGTRKASLNKTDQKLWSNEDYIALRKQ